jgi:tetratricopeptide (TPR) repeat protein
MKKKQFIYIIAVIVLAGTNICAVAQKHNKHTNNQNPEETKVLTSKEVEVISYYYDATTQKLLGNQKEALSLFLLCIAKDPKNSGAYFEAAALYNELKQPSLGVAYAKQAADLDPKNTWYLREYADLLIQTGKIKQASKVYDQLLKLEPNDQDLQLEKADILIYLKQYKPAVDIYNKLEQKLGIVPEIILQKQKLYLAQGKYDAAEKEMENLITKYPNDPEYYGMFAEFYITIKKKEKALKMFEKVLELDPTNPIIHLALANYYQEIGDNAKSYEYLKMAFRNPEVEMDNKIKIMLSYYDLSATRPERKKEADELMDILLQVHPQEPKVWSIKGDFLLREGKIDETIFAFEKVLEFETDKYPVWDELMVLYNGKGDYYKLESQSSKALELFPSMPVFYYYNGYANYIKGNYTKALESYITGKDLVVGDPEMKASFLIGIAEVYTLQKKFTDAESYYESALTVQGNNVEVLTSYAYYLCSTKKDLARAADLANNALKIEPDNYKVWDVLAWIHFKSTNTAEALNAIRTSIQKGGDKDALVLEHYGDILFKSGQTTEALEQWNKAKKANGKYSDMLDMKIQQQKLVE